MINKIFLNDFLPTQCIVLLSFYHTVPFHLITVGPYCQYMETEAARTALNECGTFQEYLDGLSRENCPTTSIANISREAGFTWTPDETTPNTVYYQVFD